VTLVKIDYVKGSNIISLEPRRMAEVFPSVNQIDAYWTALKGGDALPRRSAIDPRGIEAALHQAFILERVASTVARFRLAGTHLADLMGMEVRGMPLTAMFLPDARPAAASAVERAFAGPAKVILDLTGDRGIGRPPLDGRMILLPVLDEQGSVTRLLGALEAKGQIGRQPRRFAVTGSQAIDIPGLRTSAPAFDPAPAPAPGMAEAPAPFTPKGRPALRLVRGED